MSKGAITVEEFPEYLLVQIKIRKLYRQTVQTFRERMFSLLEEGHSRIVIDLSEVEIMNSSGLGVLLHMWDTLSQVGGYMVVTGLGPLLTELFERMRLDELIPVAGSCKEAEILVKKQ
jgi:anti-sigma B factor antagonist